MIYPIEDRILKKMSLDLGMSKAEIKFITDTQFEFTKKMIASGEGKSMRLKYLGKFDTIEKQKHRFNGTNKEQ